MGEEKKPLIQMYWIHALTPIHAGAGAGMGFIDLPIMREKTTGWPILPGTAVKGVVADDGGNADERKKDSIRRAAFGIAESSQDGYGSHTGSLVFSDARLVCLPVRSLYGTFAWVTSPLALARVKRDLAAVGIGQDLPELYCQGDALLATKSSSLAAPPHSSKAYLADLDFSLQRHDDAGRWARDLGKWLFADSENWQTEFAARLAVVANDTFDFLSETATEVNARVRIETSKKTVADGALWYEEALPAESILAGVVWCDKDYSGKNLTAKDILGRFCVGTKLLQIGGKATVGRGRVRCIFGGGYA